MRAVEQALKGINAEIAEVDTEIDLLDIAASIAYNEKQQRVYMGRIERNTRLIHEEVRNTSKSLGILNKLLAFALGVDLEDFKD